VTVLRPQPPPHGRSERGRSLAPVNAPQLYTTTSGGEKNTCWQARQPLSGPASSAAGSVYEVRVIDGGPASGRRTSVGLALMSHVSGADQVAAPWWLGGM